jgi:hypothetical protein
VKPGPQFSVLIHLREYRSGVFLVTQIGYEMAARVRKEARPLVMENAKKTCHQKLVPGPPCNFGKS